MKEDLVESTLGDLKGWPVSVRVMVAVAVGVLFLVFVFYPAYPMATWKSLGGWTWAACNSYNGFLHGRLVPLIFPWMIWWAWRSRKEKVVKPSYWGLVWMCLALFLFLASMRLVQPRWALFGLPFLMIGSVQYLFGGKIAKAVIFPAFFLWFAIPIPGLESFIRGRWTENVVDVAMVIGGWFGIDLVKEGSTVVERDSNSHFAFGRSGGIRFIVWTVMIGACVAFFGLRTGVRQVLLFVASIPLIFISAVVRLVILFGLVSLGKAEWANYLFHDWMAIFQFLFVMGALLVVRWAILKLWPERIPKESGGM